jgi:hypothetical protein
MRSRKGILIATRSSGCVRQITGSLPPDRDRSDKDQGDERTKQAVRQENTTAPADFARDLFILKSGSGRR